MRYPCGATVGHICLGMTPSGGTCQNATEKQREYYPCYNRINVMFGGMVKLSNAAKFTPSGVVSVKSEHYDGILFGDRTAEQWKADFVSAWKMTHEASSEVVTRIEKAAFKGFGPCLEVPSRKFRSEITHPGSERVMGTKYAKVINEQSGLERMQAQFPGYRIDHSARSKEEFEKGSDYRGFDLKKARQGGK